MNKIISIFPSSNADENIAFYKALGFELKGKFNRGYYVLTYKEVYLEVDFLRLPRLENY